MDNQIFTSNLQNEPKLPKKDLPVVKIIFIILILVIGVELIWGLKTLLTPVKVATQTRQPVTNVISDGSIVLLSSKPVYKVGEVVPVTINITTGGHLTAGVDLVLKYDPSKLTASPSSFIKGNIYDDYPPINVDSKGTIRISGLIATNKPGFSGEGILGVINFKALSLGMADLSLDFAPNLTSDSNMFEVGTNKDVLGQVVRAKINIE